MAQRDLTGHILDGRYRVVEPVGMGAMGSVYRAEHLKLGRVVAIKFINEHVSSGMSSRARFEREALAMAKLEHPHCASVLDVGLYEDMPYVVMDFVAGQDLKELLTAGPVPIERTIELMRQLLSGLGHAHECGIVHRDIKPGNIVLSQKLGLGDHVKILDFGLAKFNQETSSLTTGVVVGTPSYMAPEQILGRPLDHRADLYACGVLLFELLTGVKPFRSASNEPVEVCMMHLNVPAPRLCDALPGQDFGALEDVVARALAKHPDQRFANATEFANALAEARAGTGGRARVGATTSPLDIAVPSIAAMPFAQAPGERDPAAREVKRPSSWRRPVVIGVGSLLIAGALVVVFVATRPGTNPPAPAPEVPVPAQAPVDAAPSTDVATADAVADLIRRADELASAGRRESAIDLLVKARKTYPDDARLPYRASLVYLDRMWWADGLKQARSAISLDPNLKNDAQLIKAVLRGFNTTAYYDWTLAKFLHDDIGPAAKPYLEQAAHGHANPLIRKRAAAELRRY